MMFCTNDWQVVEVKPFLHQVGGHTCLFEITPETICKPYQEREFKFYQNIPDNMREFTPHYQGIVRVRCSHDDKATIFHAEVPGYILRGDTDGPDGSQHRVPANETVKSGLDHWSISCIDRQIQRHGYWSNGTQEFIMLGNLVGALRMPCILDLKMGTRQHGDDSSEEKRKLLQDRCANSTSATLGIRVCGMQVYQSDTNTYISRNKYHGRTLDDEGLRQEVRQFFCNNNRLNVPEVTRMIQKLQRLHQVLSTQDTFYFFSCSLLLLYDGYCSQDQAAECSDSPETSLHSLEEGHASDLGSMDNGVNNVDDMTVNAGKCSQSADKDCSGDVRLIDFAHTVIRSEVTDQKDGGVEEGILFGILNLIDILESFIGI